MVDLSVIIPCYNHGAYLGAAIASAQAIDQKYSREIIVVDDGSTDKATLLYLAQLENDTSVRLIRQPNRGPSVARNTAIRHATGRYILPLDADNQLRAEATSRAIAMLDMQPDIHVVYGDQALIGERSEIVRPGSFNLQRIMLANYIDVCAIYRREVWVSTGGYDIALRQGLEDWEFWLHAAFKGFCFHYLSEVMYDYHVLPTSRTAILNRGKGKHDEIQRIMAAKHPQHYGPQYVDADMVQKFRRSPLGFIGKMILMAYLPHQFEKLVRRGQLRRHI
jgi:glycosyltransferase involved in cell wall biosynthesis